MATLPAVRGALKADASLAPLVWFKAGGAAQWLLTEAYASAQVSALGPYSYSSLLWSIALGWMVWGDVPAPSMLAGAALIVVAGLYILHRELVRRRQAAEGG